jgi:hypothetical protein
VLEKRWAGQGLAIICSATEKKHKLYILEEAKMNYNPLFEVK